MESPSLERNGVSSFHLLGVGLCAFPLNMTSLIWAIAAKDNRKYAKSKSPKPSSVPESAGTSSAPFGSLFGPGLPEHKVAPVVFGAGEFEHKRFCMDVSTNPREEKHDSGASGTSISENKSVFGGHRTKV